MTIIINYIKDTYMELLPMILLANYPARLFSFKTERDKSKPFWLVRIKLTMILLTFNKKIDRVRVLGNATKRQRVCMYK